MSWQVLLAGVVLVAFAVVVLATFRFSDRYLALLVGPLAPDVRYRWRAVREGGYVSDSVALVLAAGSTGVALLVVPVLAWAAWTGGSRAAVFVAAGAAVLSVVFAVGHDLVDDEPGEEVMPCTEKSSTGPEQPQHEEQHTQGD